MLPKEREHYVLDNLSLVHYVLQKKMHIMPYWQDYEDYYQEGCIGLILSAIRFDESKGFQFSTYATSMIQGSILRYKRERGFIVKLPRARNDMIMKVMSMHEEGYTISEIKELTQFSYYDIQRALSVTNIESLNREVSEDIRYELHEIITDGSDYYRDLLSQENILECISKVSSEIHSDLQKDIWEEWIYAKMYGEDLRQEYFSKKYNISQCHVSRILNRCKKLFERYFYS